MILQFFMIKKAVYLIATLLLLSVFGLTACSSSGREKVTQDSVTNAVQDESLVTQEIRYRKPKAGEVILGWGIDGWTILPEEMLSAETFIQNNVMHTPMQPEGNDFVVRVKAPMGVTIDYGFLITKDQSGNSVDIWDGDYQVTATTNGVAEVQAQTTQVSGNATAGEDLFIATCSICHGPSGKGVPGLGKNMTTSKFVAAKSDQELVDFIKAGRDPSDPLNTTGVAMPPYGGNPTLSDEDLGKIVAYIRTLAAPTQAKLEETPAPAQNQKDPIVIAGFTLTPYSIQPGKYLTSLEFGPDGNLYVCSYDGTIWVIADQDGDSQGDESQLYAEGFEKPVGLAWHDQELYVASQGKITALRDQNGDGYAEETRDVVSGLPAGIHPVHANNDLTFGPDDRLYFGVGSTSNASPETHKYAASILSVNSDGSDLQVVATGVRNSYDVAFNLTGDLFATDNGPDGAEVENTFPPDELNQIIPGGDYGFPYYFGPPEIDSGTLEPVLVFPIHSAPAGIVFYKADQFPAEYEGDAFVALWTHGQLYRVQLAQTPQGDYVAKGSMFASGLPGVVDVTVGPEGSLYVSASENATIYRISYNTP